VNERSAAHYTTAENRPAICA